MMRTLLVFALLALLYQPLSAQVPVGGNCGNNLVLAAFCVDACVTCDGLDGYMDTNSNGAGQAPPNHCAPQIHNPRWIGFVAGSSSLEFDVNVNSCNDGNGLQIGVFSTTDCNNFSSVMNCEPDIPPNTTATFTGNGLTVGGTYFIVIDGNFDDVCDFDIELVSGSMTAPDLSAQGPVPINGIDEICPGGMTTFSVANPVFGAGIYVWEFQGMEIGYDQFVSITAPSTPGVYTICVTPSNPCSTGAQSCHTFEVAEPEPIVEPPVDLCFGESIMFHGTVLFETGSYSIIEPTPEGCMQEYQIDVEVFQPVTGPDEFVTICEDEGFWTGGEFGDGFYIDESGEYQFILTTVQGCDSVQTFNVTAHDSYDETINPQICDGESFTVSDTQGNSFTYTTEQAGGYVAELQTVQGCDSIVNVMLTVVQSSDETITATVCPGEGYTLNGTTYTVSGTYDEDFQTVDGCDSTVTLILTVDNPVANLGNIDICPDGDYTIAGQTFTGGGTYQATATSVQGCDSLINFTLVEQDAIETLLQPVICSDETYTLDGTSYNMTDIYEVVYPSVGGCDSTVIIDLTVNPVIENDIVATICTGQSYTLGSSSYSVQGMYSETFTAANGCDSIVSLDLSVGDGFITNLNPVICDGESFQVAGETLDVAGNYSYDLTSTTDCDSTVNVNLTILPLTSGVQTASICQGETYTYEGTDYNAGGQYEVILTGPNGCDSTVTLDLTILQPSVNNVSATICPGQTYTVGSSVYDTQGDYVDMFTAANGCDSTVNLSLTVSDQIIAEETITICDDESVTVGSNTYNTDGTYSNDFVTSGGCDSTYVLTLVVNESLTTDLTITICDDESYTAGGVDHNETGVYTYDLSSAVTGCDSTVTLDLTVLDTYETFLTPALCDGETVTVGSNTYATSGDYTDVLMAVNGCDSTVFTSLTILNVPTTTLTPSICDGDSVTVGGNTYTTSGTYTDVLTAANGCDSTVTTELTVLMVPATVQSLILCQGETVTVGANTYDASGTYDDMLVAANGCDSLVQTELTVNPTYEQDINGQVCEGGSYSIAGQTFTMGGDYDLMLQTAAGCDSIIHLSLEQTPFYETNLVEAICDGESFTVGSNDYTTSGNYTDSFTSTDGCDSIVNLALTVNPLPMTPLPVAICDGEVYTMGGEDFTTSGLYERTFASALTGCDSTVMLDLTVNQVFSIDQSEIICAGESVTIGSSVYTETGQYSDIFTTVSGCDSIVNLDLLVNEIPTTALNEDICEGESYTVGGTDYSTTGTFVETLMAVTGCDSIVTLNLQVTETVITTLVEEICDGENFTVGGSSYTTTGDFTDVLTSVNTGCDSVVNLALTVNEVFAITLDESICDDETFTVGTESFGTAGTHIVNLTTASGCDSIVTLNLATFPCQLSVTTSTVDVSCNGGADGSFTLTVENGTPPFLVTWFNFDTFEDGQFTLNGVDISQIADGLSPGPHLISVEDANNVIWSDELIISEPTAIAITLTPSDYNGFNVSCEGAADGFIDAAVSGGTPPYTLNWDGGSNTDLPVGEHTLQVIDANGCEMFASVVLDAPTPIRASLITTDPPCVGDATGVITVEAPAGGTPPYLYSIDNGAFMGSPIFTGISVGTHRIEIQDANGCTWVEETVVSAATELSVNLTLVNSNTDPELDPNTIELGDSVQLNVTTTALNPTFSWQGNWMTCEDTTAIICEDPFIAPRESTTYRVTVTDENGCTNTEQITIYVDKKRNVFIPSAFSPDGDGTNDLFMIFGGDDVVAIRNFHVFNRWGESMRSIPGPFAANDALQAWDGFHRGQEMNAGVYVYVAEIEFTDGERIVYKGDVVLLR